MPDLLEALRRILPEGCASAARDPRVEHPLLAGEDASNMVAKRRAEFSAGRAAARAALSALGLASVPLPKGADRAPIWPEGIAGSITHSASHCLAVAARGWRAIGIDIEPDQPLAEGLARLIAMPEDLGGSALEVFCVKEAAFKAQFMVSRKVLAPDDMRVQIAADHFTASFTRAAGPFAQGYEIKGRILRAEGHILTACWF